MNVKHPNAKSQELARRTFWVQQLLNQKSTKQKLSPEDIHARLIFLIGATLALTFFCVTVGTVYALIFVTQPIGALTPSGARPTRQDMEKAEKLQSEPVDHYKPANVKTAAESIGELKQVLGAKLMSEPPKCQHGHRLKRLGTSEKSGKPYLGWACSEKNRAKQCPIIWWKQTPDGDDWLSPEDYADYLNERGLNLDPKIEKEPVPDDMLSEKERAAK